MGLSFLSKGAREDLDTVVEVELGVMVLAGQVAKVAREVEAVAGISMSRTSEIHQTMAG